MNRQVVPSIDANNAGVPRQLHNKPSILCHQAGGKRKALSTLNTKGQGAHGNNNILTKNQNKCSFKNSQLPLVPTNRQPLRQCLENSTTLQNAAEQSSKTQFAFKIFCDEEQNKENTRPSTSVVPAPTRALKYTKTTASHSFLKAESPGAQEDREDEEIVVVDSPMVVDSSIENLSLKERPQHDDQFLLPEYSQEIYVYLKGVEARMRPRANYMRKQTDITPSMRRILVDWLVEVSQEYKLDQETLYLAVSYIDRFLSYMAVFRAKLQLVGTACMFIAAKFEEIYPPDVSEFVYITDDTYTKQQVLRMEHLVLKVLSFNLAIPTANFFLQRICSLCNVGTPTQFLAMYLCELCLLDADPFLKYLPSEMACAALALASHTMGKEMWSSELQLVTEYTEEDFRDCLESLHSFYLEAEACPQQAIQEKYKSHKFHSVSSITAPRSLPPR